MSKIKIVLVLGFIALLIGSLGFYFTHKNGKQQKYRTEKIERGDVISSVTATGTLAALTTVKVGSQVSGIISQLYADFNSQVKKGQLLAELDPTTFQAQVDQRRADVDRARVECRNQKIAFDRAKNLLANELLSKAEYDTSEANLLAAEAAIKQSEAALRQAETNLSYTKITSPIDGVVVDRQYDIGQTVAASFQAPTLFTIAQDLKQMQVSTSIDEADIGRIDTGKEANFTVDAFPDRTFNGTISQIRLSPQVVNNVTTYPVLIDVSNQELLLKPGMTANVTIPVEKTPDALKVPNAALRFKPDPADLAEGVKASYEKHQDHKSSPPSKETGGKKESTLYVLTPEGKLKPVTVQTFLTDGAYTAIQSASLKEGDSIVTGLETTRAMEATGGFGGRRRF
jgi:HlyD family secretion protein